MNDIESRLQSTYTAVAERTTATDRLDEIVTGAASGTVGAVVELTPQRHRRVRWSTFAAAAALVAVVAGAVVFVVRPGRDDASVSSVEAMRDRMDRAVLMAPPEGMGLVGIESRPDGNRLEYTDGTRTLVITTTEGGLLPPGDGFTLVDTLAVRWREGEVEHVAWEPRPGVLVEVSLDDAITDDLLADVILVSTEAWDQLSAESGFAEVIRADEAVVSPDFPAFDVEDTASPLTRSIHGSLQGGITIRSGCCEGQFSLSSASAYGLFVNWRIDDVFIVDTGWDVEHVDIVLGGETIATVRTVEDPSTPRKRVATFRVPDGVTVEQVRSGAVAVAVVDGAEIRQVIR